MGLIFFFFKESIVPRSIIRVLNVQEPNDSTGCLITLVRTEKLFSDTKRQVLYVSCSYETGLLDTEQKPVDCTLEIQLIKSNLRDSFKS